MTTFIVFIAGFILGVFALLGYMISRMLRSDGWDSSNITNALRLISHTTLHPEDFGKMWYIDAGGYAAGRPFWYIGGDEFADNVRTRPRQS